MGWKKATSKMFEFIEGNLVAVTPTEAVVEASGIGYLFQISMQSYGGLQGVSSVRLYVHQVLRDDSNELYGFLTREERALFRLLITVSGVGPSTARTILSAYDPGELAALIEGGNDAALRKVKGIGTKTAQRIVVDLRGKMGGVEFSPDSPIGQHNTTRNEALSALVTLGFPRSVSEKQLDALLQGNPNLSVEQLIKQALRQL